MFWMAFFQTFLIEVRPISYTAKARAGLDLWISDVLMFGRIAMKLEGFSFFGGTESSIFAIPFLVLVTNPWLIWELPTSG